MKKRNLSLFGHTCRMNNNRLIKTVVTGMTIGRRKRGDQGQNEYLTSKNGLMGVFLTVFIGPKFTLNGENASSWR